MKKIKAIIVFLLLPILILGMIPMIAAADTALKNNWLGLSQNTTGPRHIVDTNNQPFRMFGMARSQICEPVDETPKFGKIRELSAHYKNLGANTMRLAISVFTMLDESRDFIKECGGYNDAGIKKFIEKYVDPDVQGIIDSGMYVILDLHEYPPTDDKNDPNPKLILDYAMEHYIPIWKGLAQYYKDEPMIAMYELWNEPYAADQGSLKFNGSGKIQGGKYDGFDWNKGVQEFYKKCAAEVRKYDTRHMLLISDWNAGWGAAWQSTWGADKYAMDPEHQNVIFSVHAGHGQLGDDLFSDGWNYNVYWSELAEKNNIAIHFGEVEAEEERDTDCLGNFVKMMKDRADKFHYSAMLWRPRTDIRNRVDLWTDFAKSYSTKVKIVKQPSQEPTNSPKPTEPTTSAAESTETVTTSSELTSDALSETAGKGTTSATSGGTKTPKKMNMVLLVVMSTLGMLGIAGGALFFLYKKERGGLNKSNDTIIDADDSAEMNGNDSEDKE